MTVRQHEVPGREADTPREIPAKGWLQIAKRAWAESKADQVPLLAAGVAFYAFLSLFPALIAGVMIYGLVSTPEDVTKQIESISSGLPSGADELLSTQLTSIASTSDQALGFGLVVSVLLALWSASGGVGNLVTALNTAYDEDETRGFIQRKALSLMLTLGAIVFMLVAVTAVAVVPVVADAMGLGALGRVLVEVVRWGGLVVAVMAALAVLYRVAADRDAPKMRWVSVGAMIATLVWVIASIGFSLYVDLFGSYAKTYGSLAGVVVLLMWLWITCFIVLFGAEVNAEAEQQTARDTTKGPPQPEGRRGAVKADTPPEAAST
jgi:membrane protein